MFHDKTLLNSRKDLLKGIPDLTVSCAGSDGQSLIGEDGVLSLSAQEGETLLVDIVLANVGSAPVCLTHCEMIRKCRVFTLQDSQCVTDGIGRTATIQPGMHVLPFFGYC